MIQQFYLWAQSQKDWAICTPMSTAALFWKPKRQKATQESTDRWMDKQNTIYIKWSSILPSKRRWASTGVHWFRIALWGRGTSLIPGPGRCHVPRGHDYPRTWEPRVLKPAPRAWVHEKPPQRKKPSHSNRKPLLAATGAKTTYNNKNPAQPKIKINKYFF